MIDQYIVVDNLNKKGFILLIQIDYSYLKMKNTWLYIMYVLVF